MTDFATIIISVLGGGTVGVVFKSIYDRVCQKRDRNDEVILALKELQRKSDKRDIEISKILLTILIEHNPRDHKSILDEALRYFGVLGGDSWMWDKLSDWAKAESVDVSYLQAFHERNMKKA